MNRNHVLTGWLLVALALSWLALGMARPACAATEDAQATAQQASSESSDQTATEDAITRFCEKVFYPVLSPIFKPVDRFMRWVDRPNLGGFCGMGLFLSAMLWVGFLLNKDYVNRGRTVKSIATDLRVWTVISMTPHVLVYFYFR